MMARNPHGKKAYSCLARSSKKLTSNRLLRCSTARQQGRRGPGGSAEPLLQPALDHTTGSRHLAAAPTPADTTRKTSQEAPRLFRLRFPKAHPSSASKSITVWRLSGTSFQEWLVPLSPREGEHPSSPSTALGCISSQWRGRAQGSGCSEERGFCFAHFARLFFFFPP